MIAAVGGNICLSVDVAAGIIIRAAVDESCASVPSADNMNRASIDENTSDFDTTDSSDPVPAADDDKEAVKSEMADDGEPPDSPELVVKKLLLGMVF